MFLLEHLNYMIHIYISHRQHCCRTIHISPKSGLFNQYPSVNPKMCLLKGSHKICFGLNYLSMMKSSSIYSTLPYLSSILCCKQSEIGKRKEERAKRAV